MIKKRNRLMGLEDIITESGNKKRKPSYCEKLSNSLNNCSAESKGATKETVVPSKKGKEQFKMIELSHNHRIDLMKLRFS